MRQYKGRLVSDHAFDKWSGGTVEYEDILRASSQFRWKRLAQLVGAKRSLLQVEFARPSTFENGKDYYYLSVSLFGYQWEIMHTYEDFCA